jgi:hypothetical protein
MNGRKLLATALGCGALVASIGWTGAPPARAEIEVYTRPVATAPVVVGSATLQADQISAQSVRARAIYANRIDADRVHGVIYQTGGVTMTRAGSLGDISAPEVTASVIYADEIRANDVTADAIYVRSLRER